MRIKNPALIIVDMQNDFLHPKGFVPRHAGSIGIPQASFDLLRSPTAAIKKLADHFHGAARPVVYVYTAWETDYSDVAIPLKNMRDTAQREGALVRDSWGAAVIDELTPREGSVLVMKKSYGGFFQTPLDRVLRNRGVTTLFLTGVATNFCVETTAREAVAYGYEIAVVSDATATYDPEGHQASLKVLATGFGDVLTTDEVIALLA